MSIIKKMKIPEARKAVLIGTEGCTKKQIQKTLGVKLYISDDIEIEGEPVDVMDAENTVKAIGRGFEPETALKLADEEYMLLVIPLPKSKREMTRIKSR